MNEHRQTESFVNFLERFSDNQADVFWVYELKSNKVIYVSPSYEQVFGKSCIGLLMDPESFKDVTHPKDIATVDNLINELKTGDSVSFEYRIIHPSSRVKWILSRIIPFHLKGKHVWSVVSSKDVTKKKKIKSSVYESEKILKIILDTTSDFILLSDINQKIILANKTVSKNIEVEQKNLIGTHLSSLFPSELYAIVNFNFERVVKSKTLVEFRTHSGGRLNHYLHPIVNASNEILGVLYCIQSSTTHLFGDFNQHDHEEIDLNYSSAEIETIYQSFKVMLTNENSGLKNASDSNLNNFFALLKQILESKGEAVPELKGPGSLKQVLSSRELEIANLIKEGKTNKEIAQMLNLSVRTIEAHRYNMRDKVGLKHKRKKNLRNQLFFILSEST